VYISCIWGGQNPLGGLSPIFFGRRYPRRNDMFQIWWRSVQGFSVGWGSNFAIPHWLRWSSLQHSHTTVWACDLSPLLFYNTAALIGSTCFSEIKESTCYIVWLYLFLLCLKYSLVTGGILYVIRIVKWHGVNVRAKYYRTIDVFAKIATKTSAIRKHNTISSPTWKTPVTDNLGKVAFCRN